MDAVSPEIKSKIFVNYAKGMQAAVDSASMTKKQMYKLWKAVYPDLTDEEFEIWRKGITDTAAHKQFIEMDSIAAQDFMTAKNDE